jgi:5-methylcytosine-specific restriction protein A
MGLETFEEGRVKFQLHRRKERNRGAVRRKKEITLARHGALLCEVCDFDFMRLYGALGHGFAECHHKLPLAALEEGHRTRLSELAIVCANCHRMLHKRPMLTIGQLREVVLRQRAQDSLGEGPRRSH